MATTTANFFVVWEPPTHCSELLSARLTVLPGYRTNGASVPRLLRPVLDSFGSTVLASAIVHDCLYEAVALPRALADAVFLEAMLTTGTSAVVAKSAWSAVRVLADLLQQQRCCCYRTGRNVATL